MSAIVDVEAQDAMAQCAGAAAGDPDDAKLSKNEQKRRLMIARIQAKKAERQRQHEDMMAERAAARLQRLSALPPEEFERVQAKNAAMREQRRAQKEAERERLRAAMAGGPRLVIDLDFQEHADEKWVKSLARQIVDVYGSNKALEQPWRVSLCGWAGAARAQLEPKLSGLEEWVVGLHEGEYGSLFAREELVYLSPDAADVLEAVDPAKVYVLGAIIDRNIIRGLTQGKAQRQGIASARLPLEKCPLGYRNHAFPLNHVFACMAALAGPAKGDWGAAFRIGLERTKTDPRSRARREEAKSGGAAPEGAEDGAAEEGGG